MEVEWTEVVVLQPVVCRQQTLHGDGFPDRPTGGCGVVKFMASQSHVHIKIAHSSPSTCRERQWVLLRLRPYRNDARVRFRCFSALHPAKRGPTSY